MYLKRSSKVKYFLLNGNKTACSYYLIIYLFFMCLICRQRKPHLTLITFKPRTYIRLAGIKLIPDTLKLKMLTFLRYLKDWMSNKLLA